MESVHHFSSKPDCNNTADDPSFILRTALSEMPFVSDRWRVDSVISLHRICQIPMGSQCKRPSAFPKAQEYFVNSFAFPENFLFCPDKIELIEWLNLVPRLSIGDCFEIHIPHWRLCDLLLSSHQNFLPEVLNFQFAFCKESLSSWFACRLRNFGLVGSGYE